MELITAANALSALAQPSRLEVFRLLVRCGEQGICAGDISKQLDIPKPTLSFHGRSIIYRLNVTGMKDLMTFLTEDCCQGHPELCSANDDCC